MIPVDPWLPKEPGAMVRRLTSVLADHARALNASGVYIPTITHVLNITASTPFECQYLRLGDVVHVSGYVQIDVTAAGFSKLTLSLPVPSAFTGLNQCCGTANSTAGDSAAIIGDGTNHGAQICWTATVTTAQNFAFSFLYRVQ